MKNLTFLLLLFLPIFIFAQNDFHKWQFGVTFSPDYAYRTLVNAKNITSFDIGKLGYTTGINVNYNFSEMLGIEIGVQFSEKGYQTEEIPKDLLIINGLFSDRIKYIYQYKYIDIPLKANFTFGENKLSYIAVAGIIPNFLIDAKAIYSERYGNGPLKKIRDTETPDFNKFNVSTVIGAGIEYKISNEISLRAIPQFRFGLIKPHNILYLWNLGLEFGIFYGIK